MMRITLLLVLVSVIYGCQQSPRKNIYLLSADPAPAAEKHAAINQVIGLGPISLADYLQRSSIVRNKDANRLQLVDIEHWGEPLDKGISRVLAINLMNKNPQRVIENFPWRSYATPNYSLRITVYDLQVIHGEASINANWKLMSSDNKKIIHQQHFVRRTACGNSATEIAKAYSELFAELATEMDKAIALAE